MRPWQIGNYLIVGFPHCLACGERVSPRGREGASVLMALRSPLPLGED